MLLLYANNVGRESKLLAILEPNEQISYKNNIEIENIVCLDERKIKDYK